MDTLIKSFRDLIVYKDSYDLCITVMKEIIPLLPETERYDLKDQLSRSSKAIPRLVAEGYAKKHQYHGFQKYLDDANAESNETIVSLEQAKDIYNIKAELCRELIDRYDKLSRQLYKLAFAWDKFKNNRKTTSSNDTSRENVNR